jgi:caffeoyl-CoA O-methyltransferase
MSRHFSFDEPTYQYLVKTSVRETDVARRLREETQQLPMAQMQIGPDQGQFLQLLVQLIQAKKTLEVGVFTGYSSLWVAQALPDEGKIVACDVSEEYTAVARRYWKEAGVDHKIDLRLRPALETLDELLAQGGASTFDFAFIDADKSNYDNTTNAHCSSSELAA